MHRHTSLVTRTVRFGNGFGVCELEGANYLPRSSNTLLCPSPLSPPSLARHHRCRHRPCSTFCQDAKHMYTRDLYRLTCTFVSRDGRWLCSIQRRTSSLVVWLSHGEQLLLHLKHSCVFSSRHRDACSSAMVLLLSAMISVTRTAHTNRRATTLPIHNV
jgi:hypothetical protein